VEVESRELWSSTVLVPGTLHLHPNHHSLPPGLFFLFSGSRLCGVERESVSTCRVREHYLLCASSCCVSP
jgi:hypothetical protein